MRLLGVRRAFAVQPVGRGELPLEFDLRLLFPPQVERRLALVRFERIDPALQFLHLPRAFLAAGRARGVARHRQPELPALLKFRDLLRERGLLLREAVALHGQLGEAPVGVLALGRPGLERVEFALQRLGLLLRFEQIFRGLRAHAFFKGDLLHLVVRHDFRAHHFGYELFALLGDSVPLLRERGELPLEFALRPRELRAHGLARAEQLLAGKFVVILERRVQRGAAGIERKGERAVVGHDAHIGRGGRLPREFQHRRGRRGGRGAGRRDAAGLGHAGDDIAAGALAAQPLGERVRGAEREPFAARRGGAGVGQQAHDFLPRETHLRRVVRADFLAENLRRAPVQLGQRDGRLPAGDAVGEVGDVKLQLGRRVVRAVVEFLLRDAREEIAEFEQDFVPGLGRGRAGRRGVAGLFRQTFESGGGRRLEFGLVRRLRGGRFLGRAAVLAGAFEAIEK